MDTIGTYTVNDLRFAKMTVAIKTTKQFRLRLWLAVQLIRLAGYVLGCEIAVEDKNASTSGE